MSSGRARPIHLGEHFLVTSSLTKAYGLSGLRCGWVLANPELTQRMWHINDLYGVNAAYPADLLSVIALDNLDRVAARAKKLLAVNRPSLNAFLRSRDDLACLFVRNSEPSSFPSCCSPGPWTISIGCCARNMRPAIVPGSYFDMPQTFSRGNRRRSGDDELDWCD